MLDLLADRGVAAAQSGSAGVRARERAVVGAVLTDLTVPTHIEITGEPGIGKTWMLAEIASMGRAHGHTTLSGSASPSTVDGEFGAFVDAIDAQLGGLTAGVLPPRVRRALAEIFPSFPYRAGDDAAPAGPPVPAVRLLLETIAANRPLVVTLDDLHLADGRTVDLVRALLRSPLPAPVLLACAYRPRQASARLRNAFASAPVGHRLPLRPLSVAQVRMLVGDCASPARCRALHRDSQGNPRYLAALLHEPEREDGRAADAMIVAELDELSADARLAAAAGAILGDDFGVADGAVVTELPEAAMYSAIDELAAADIVRELPEPGRFTFRHPVVRQAIHRSTRPGWRLGAQARAGRISTAPANTLAEPARPPEPVAQLTRRELQVARLVAEGMTNREIAAALYVTEKTVEMHLSNVFTKLGVRNRVGVARTLHA